jgi:hypothetical protein
VHVDAKTSDLIPLKNGSSRTPERRKRHAKSRVSNGADILPHVDGRSLVARRTFIHCMAACAHQAWTPALLSAPAAASNSPMSISSMSRAGDSAAKLLSKDEARRGLSAASPRRAAAVWQMKKSRSVQVRKIAIRITITAITATKHFVSVTNVRYICS